MITVTSTVPVPAGLDTIIWEAVSLMKLVTCVDPKSTAVASARFMPVIVTSVPPVVGPAAGLTPVTAGRPSRSRPRCRWRCWSRRSSHRRSCTHRAGVSASIEAGQAHTGQGRDAVGVGRRRAHGFDGVALVQRESDGLARQRRAARGQGGRQDCSAAERSAPRDRRDARGRRVTVCALR